MNHGFLCSPPVDNTVEAAHSAAHPDSATSSKYSVTKS